VSRGSDLVFVTAGEGGGTGTGAAPVIARCARARGAHGRHRDDAVRVRGQAPQRDRPGGPEALQDGVDTLIVVPNDRLPEVLERGVSMVDASAWPTTSAPGVQGICDLITRPGVINLDFADVRTVMQSRARRSWASAWRPARRGREAARARSTRR
jgi:cell division protein FtsZ